VQHLGHTIRSSRSWPKTCVLIDGQAFGKPDGCQTFGNYAEVFMQAVTNHVGEHTGRVDVVFDRYIGDALIKAVTRS